MGQRLKSFFQDTVNSLLHPLWFCKLTVFLAHIYSWSHFCVTNYFFHHISRLAFITPLFTCGGFFLLQERKRGILRRASVSGASTWESLVVHFFLQLPSLLFGTTPILILVPMFVFGLQIKMQLIWEVVLLLVLTGFLGMSFSKEYE